MKRSLQEVVELVVFGLVALLVGTGLLWLVGWLLSLGGLLLKAIAGLLWLLLRFVVPVALVAGLVYFLVKALQNRSEAAPAAGTGTGPSSSHAQSVTPAAEAPTANAPAMSAAPTVTAPEPSGAAAEASAHGAVDEGTTTAEAKPNGAVDDEPSTNEGA